MRVASGQRGGGGGGGGEGGCGEQSCGQGVDKGWTRRLAPPWPSRSSPPQPTHGPNCTSSTRSRAPRTREHPHNPVHESWSEAPRAVVRQVYEGRLELIGNGGLPSRTLPFPPLQPVPSTAVPASKL